MRVRHDNPVSVAQLNRAVRLRHREGFGDVLVLGEIGDLTRAASGHVYFTLNDEIEQAQMRVVMFKSDARRTRATLETGARIASARRPHSCSSRAARFSCSRARALPAGEGDLARAISQACSPSSRPRASPIPRASARCRLLPRCIGLVTSEHGAAVHDVHPRGARRCPVRIVVAPCLVQGPDAPALDRARAARACRTCRAGRGDRGARRRLRPKTCGPSTTKPWRAPSPPVACRWSAAWATRWTPPSPIWSRTCARPRPPTRPSWSCPQHEALEEQLASACASLTRAARDARRSRAADARARTRRSCAIRARAHARHGYAARARSARLARAAARSTRARLRSMQRERELGAL